jgi:hypothetical protein
MASGTFRGRVVWGRRSRSWVWLGLVCLAGAGPVCPRTFAGDESLAVANAYGVGVHAYFNCDYQGSYDAMTAAIEAGTNDPRAFYFRGLAAAKLGRDSEVEADFAEGANREATTAGSLAISRSLERVQGADRLRLEKFRARARVAAVQRDHAATRSRYSGIDVAPADLLRTKRPVQISPPAEPVPPPAPKGKAKPDDVRRPQRPVGEPQPEPMAEPVDETLDEPAVGADPFAAPEDMELSPEADDTANPFGDEPLSDAEADHRGQMNESLDAQRRDRFDQRDQQRESFDAQRRDGFDQRSQQAEREAAAGGL